VDRASPTERLVASLLPPTWPTRAAVLAAAAHLDADAGGDGSAMLLDAWKRWRATGEAPDQAVLRDLLVTLGSLLGGIATELRFRPRSHVRQEPVAC
jgi:hypothetical protein